MYAGVVYVMIWGSAGLVAIFGGQTTTNHTNFTDGEFYLIISNISLLMHHLNLGTINGLLVI